MGTFATAISAPAFGPAIAMETTNPVASKAIATNIRAVDNTASPNRAKRETPTQDWALLVDSSAASPLARRPVVTVRSGDTLWSIAEKYDMPGATRNQEMIAIFRANPDAFIGGHINRIKAGARLVLPDAATVLAIDSTEARHLFSEAINKPLRPRPRETTHNAPCPERPPLKVWQPGDEVMIAHGQTLTEIADRYRLSNVTLPQKMTAIFKENPTAFINNDMNLMKAGARLVLPSMENAQAIPLAEAHRIVNENIAKYHRRQAEQATIKTA